MVRMISKELREYNGRRLQVGDRFDAESEHVEVLTLTGLAEVEAKSSVDGEEPAKLSKRARRSDR